MRRWVGMAVLLSVVGCGSEESRFTSPEVPAPVDVPSSQESPSPAPTPTPVGMTVGQAATAAGCATSAVRPLSAQLVAELDCLVPGAIRAIPSSSQIADSTIFAFLQTTPGESLPGVVAKRPGVVLPLTSALRTLAQQYLLYDWYQKGLCGISLAAVPGSSNHEGGLALDTPQYTAWQTALQSGSWVWFGTADPVHYTFTGSGTVTLTGKSVLAFQKLWNLNHPGDLIAEDSTWGPATESRLIESPAEGFAIPDECGNPPPAFAPLVESDLPGADRCAL